MDLDKEINALWVERDRILKKLSDIDKVPESEYKEKALEFIECHDEAKYRKKIKGFVLPFNTWTKDDTTEVDRVNKKYKYKKPKNIE